MREKLAALCHEQWSGWMKYLFSKCEPRPFGAAQIPGWAFKRWKRQMETAYSDLSEEEKESDRTEADKFLAMMVDDEWPNLARAVFQIRCETLCMPFAMFHESLEKALGRPVFDGDIVAHRDALYAELVAKVRLRFDPDAQHAGSE